MFATGLLIRRDLHPAEITVWCCCCVGVYGSVGSASSIRTALKLTKPMGVLVSQHVVKQAECLALRGCTYSIMCSESCRPCSACMTAPQWTLAILWLVPEPLHWHQVA